MYVPLIYKNVDEVDKLHTCKICTTTYIGHDVLTQSECLNQIICKHCYFSENYDENTRLEFDKRCHLFGIASYILEYYDTHNCNSCKYYPKCFLCDFRLKNPIKNILNIGMLGLSETTTPINIPEELATNRSTTNNTNNTSNVDNVDKVDNTDAIDTIENYTIIFDNELKDIKFKIPKKLYI